MKRAGLLIVLGLLWASVAHAAQEIDWFKLEGRSNAICEQGAGSSVWVNYVYRDDILAVRNRQTGELIFTVEQFDTRYINLKAWSPNCQYLVGQVENLYVIWDVVNGGRFKVLDTLPYMYAPEITWGAGDYVSISGSSEIPSAAIIPPPAEATPIPREDRFGSIIVAAWQPFDNRVLTFFNQKATEPTSGCVISFEVWDVVRQEVWLKFVCAPAGDSELRLYSLADGTLRGEYPVFIGGYEKFDYRLSEDRQFVVVSHFGSDYVKVYRRDGTLLGNLHTFHTYLPQHALSPDGRYYVIVQNQLRVWDLAQLTPAATENFTYEGSAQVMTTVRFLDGTTVETTNSDGITERWNILTGAQLP
jgi:WD40 repeat protein